MEKENKEFNEKAYGFLLYNGQWGVMELKYSTNGEVSNEMVFHKCGNDKMEAIEKYKIMVSNLF